MSTSLSPRPGRRPDPTLRSLWEKRLHHFEQSGQSASCFCAEQGLSLPSFYAWRRRLRCSDQESTPVAPGADARESLRFVPIRILPAPTAIELVLPTGAVLRVSPGCDLAFVRSLVESLGGASC
jgi:transposase